MIELVNVWKKYSTRDVFHRSLREDIMNTLAKKERENLHKGEFWAIKDISLRVKRGECLGIYGPNGSGKSTILKLIASVTFPTRGEVNVNGRIAPLIAVGAGFHHDLTGRENIYMNGTIIGMRIKEIESKIDSIIDFSEIDRKFLDMPIRKYSSGMHVRLGFSIAIHSTAEILLMDEILAVGDEYFQTKCIEKIRELNQSGKTIVIVSHDRRKVDELSDRIIFMDEGVITDQKIMS